MTYVNVNPYVTSLLSGTVAGHTIFGGSGSHTIYGDAYGLYGTVTAQSNVIWADAPNASDGSAVNTIYGNGYLMVDDTTGSGNTIHDSYGATSYLYGNAYSMSDHAWGGSNTIEALSSSSWVYGDAYQITGSATADSMRGAGVSAGHNNITFESLGGSAYGDAYSIQGTFSGGHNTITTVGTIVTVYGTAYTLGGHVAGLDAGHAACGGNVITTEGGNVYGDAYQNYGTTVGGGNVIGGSPGDVHGSCGTNYGTFTESGNTITAGWHGGSFYGSCETNSGTFSDLSGNTIWGGFNAAKLTIYGNCSTNLGTFEGGHNTIHANHGNDVIYGDCQYNAAGALFVGGHNTIYAGRGNSTMYGSVSDGHNTFVFAPGSGAPGTGQNTIMDFDHHGGAAFSHAQGDVIDVTWYHLAGPQSLSIGQNANGDAVITLPSSVASHTDQITLVGVHAGQLTASDFHF
jgi:hypothetical protein